MIIKVRRKVALYDIDVRAACPYVVATMSVRILSKKDLRRLVLYSPAHIDRLEKTGQFPKRVHLGPCRVGWLENEVLEWLQQRLNMRNMPGRSRR
jgi:prophage regulatory protein